jgi:hypothetical protein
VCVLFLRPMFRQRTGQIAAGAHEA